LNAGSVLRVEHGAGATFGSTVLNDDAWHHVAVTLEQGAPLSEAKLYVDGVEETYGQQGGDVCNTDSHVIYIGKANTKVSDGDNPIPVRHWKGLIDELRIWNVALSPEEITAVKDSTLCPADHPNLVAYFSFNEGIGTDAIDGTGNFDGIFGGDADSTNLHPTWIQEGAPVVAKDCGGGVFVERNMSKNPISVYPNPAGDYIEIETDFPVAGYVIYNISGREVQSGQDVNSSVVDISALNPGMYFVRFEAKETDAFNLVKVIKQ
jgi:hypothetical protein